MAGWRETKTLKPIDKVSLGEIASHRAVMKMNAKVASKMRDRGPSPLREKVEEILSELPNNAAAAD